MRGMCRCGNSGRVILYTNNPNCVIEKEKSDINELPTTGASRHNRDEPCDITAMPASSTVQVKMDYFGNTLVFCTCF